MCLPIDISCEKTTGLFTEMILLHDSPETFGMIRIYEVRHLMENYIMLYPRGKGLDLF